MVATMVIRVAIAYNLRDGEARRREFASDCMPARQKKFMDPRDVRPLQGQELRRARAPSLRFLVKLALRCDSVEQLGKRLRRRYQRQALRAMRAAAPPGRE
jgi:hypothetical protein